MPAGLEPPAGVIKRRKATVKKRRNTATGFKALDPKFFMSTSENYLNKNGNTYILQLVYRKPLLTILYLFVQGIKI